MKKRERVRGSEKETRKKRKMIAVKFHVRIIKTSIHDSQRERERERIEIVMEKNDEKLEPLFNQMSRF